MPNINLTLADINRPDRIIDAIRLLNSFSDAQIADIIAQIAVIDASLANKQPLDADLTAIAALSTTSFGRGFLTLADIAAGQVKIDVDFKGVQLTRSTAQSIPNNTATALIWNTEVYDIGNLHSPSTNPERINAVTGIPRMLLTANIAWASNTTGNRNVFIRKNGTTNVSGMVQAATGSTPTSLAYEGSVVAATDYFEIIVQQNSGGALNIDQTFCSFSGSRR